MFSNVDSELDLNAERKRLKVLVYFVSPNAGTSLLLYKEHYCTYLDEFTVIRKIQAFF